MSISRLSDASISSLVVRHLVLQVEPPTTKNLGVIKFHDWSLKDPTVFEYNATEVIVGELEQFFRKFNTINILCLMGNVPKEIARVLVNSDTKIDEVHLCDATIIWSQAFFLAFVGKFRFVLPGSTVFGPEISRHEMLSPMYKNVSLRADITFQESNGALDDDFLQAVMQAESPTLLIHHNRLHNFYNAATVIRVIAFVHARKFNGLKWNLGIMPLDQEPFMKEFARTIRKKGELLCESGLVQDSVEPDLETIGFRSPAAHPFFEVCVSFQRAKPQVVAAIEPAQ